jgi:electron transfer flavoprotein-quinone oxidoreductase
MADTSYSDTYDVIVVGAGPAGTSAAITCAKAGLSVIMIERGEYPGSKNVMGGILYRHPTEKIIPGFYKEAPLERHITEERVWLLSKDSAVKMGYNSTRFDEEPHNCFSVFRAQFDRWYAQKAVEEGVTLINETLVEDVIMENGKVIGIKTNREDGELYASVVVAADGANSLMAAKAGLHPQVRSTTLALAVKEVYHLDKEKIEDRFNIDTDGGVTIELLGDATQGLMGTAFIYTNKNSLSIGVGAFISQMMRKKISAYDLIESVKTHPMIRPLLTGGETKEYLAHLIPEGGYRAIPKYIIDGMVLVGDAAMLVNSLHREGSNLAMTSGRFAAEAIIKAKAADDFSAAGLSHYRDLMEDSFIIKDLKKYRNIEKFFDEHMQFFELYPKIANDAAHEFFTVDDVPKRDKQKNIWNNITDKIPTWKLLLDIYNGWRVVR